MGVDRFVFRTSVTALRQARVALGPKAADRALIRRVLGIRKQRYMRAIYTPVFMAQFEERLRRALLGANSRKYIDTGDAAFLSNVEG